MRQHIQIVSSVIALATWSFFATSCDSSELEINEAVSPEILESLEDTALEFDVSYDALRAAMLEDGLLDAGLDIRTVAAELADQGEIALPPQSIPRRSRAISVSIRSAPVAGSHPGKPNKNSSSTMGAGSRRPFTRSNGTTSTTIQMGKSAAPCHSKASGCSRPSRIHIVRRFVMVLIHGSRRVVFMRAEPPPLGCRSNSRI